MNRLQEIQERLAEIEAELARPEADLDALEREIGELKAERIAIERRSQLITDVVEQGQVVRTFPAPTPAGRHSDEQTFDAGSPEYKRAWLKNLARNPKTGEWRLGRPTEIEERAWTYTTANTTAVLPTGIALGIIEMISERYALLGDLDPTGFAGAVEFVQASAIVEGAAAEGTENTANANDLKITFTKVTMDGVEIKGQVKIGHKMKIQSMEGFESFLVNELSREMGQAANEHVFAAIDSDMTADVITPEGLDDEDIRGAFATLQGGLGARKIYANNFTIWTYLAGVTDELGQKLFIPSSLDSDPLTQGRIYGGPVRWDETIADGEVYIGYPGQIKANWFEEPNVLADVPDVTTRETVYGGYGLFEARMGDTRSFVKLEISAVS